MLLLRPRKWSTGMLGKDFDKMSPKKGMVLTGQQIFVFSTWTGETC